MSQIKYLVACAFYSGVTKDSSAVPKDTNGAEIISSHASIHDALRECHKINDVFEKIGEVDIRCCFVVADDGHYDKDVDEQTDTAATAPEPQAELAPPRPTSNVTPMADAIAKLQA